MLGTRVLLHISALLLNRWNDCILSPLGIRLLIKPWFWLLDLIPIPLWLLWKQTIEAKIKNTLSSTQWHPNSPKLSSKHQQHPVCTRKWKSGRKANLVTVAAVCARMHLTTTPTCCQLQEPQCLLSYYFRIYKYANLCWLALNMSWGWWECELVLDTLCKLKFVKGSPKLLQLIPWGNINVWSSAARQPVDRDIHPVRMRH